MIIQGLNLQRWLYRLRTTWSTHGWTHARSPTPRQTIDSYVVSDITVLEHYAMETRRNTTIQWPASWKHYWSFCRLIVKSFQEIQSVINATRLDLHHLNTVSWSWKIMSWYILIKLLKLMQFVYRYRILYCNDVSDSKSVDKELSRFSI